MQKYRMLKTVHGVREGKLHPEQFAADEAYHLDDSLADQFIELGAVELADEEGEEKSRGNAPANKAKTAAPANKSR